MSIALMLTQAAMFPRFRASSLEKISNQSGSISERTRTG